MPTLPNPPEKIPQPDPYEPVAEVIFDTEHNYPLPNLYVSMLQQLRIETARSASSTGTMRGLDVA